MVRMGMGIKKNDNLGNYLDKPFLCCAIWVIKNYHQS